METKVVVTRPLFGGCTLRKCYSLHLRPLDCLLVFAFAMAELRRVNIDGWTWEISQAVTD
jgi:hypothetical protein